MRAAVLVVGATVIVVGAAVVVVGAAVLVVGATVVVVGTAVVVVGAAVLVVGATVVVVGAAVVVVGAAVLVVGAIVVVVGAAVVVVGAAVLVVGAIVVVVGAAVVVVGAAVVVVGAAVLVGTPVVVGAGVAAAETSLTPGGTRLVVAGAAVAAPAASDVDRSAQDMCQALCFVADDGPQAACCVLGKTCSGSLQHCCQNLRHEALLGHQAIEWLAVLTGPVFSCTYMQVAGIAAGAVSQHIRPFADLLLRGWEQLLWVQGLLLPPQALQWAGAGIRGSTVGEQPVYVKPTRHTMTCGTALNLPPEHEQLSNCSTCQSARRHVQTRLSARESLAFLDFAGWPHPTGCK